MPNNAITVTQTNVNKKIEFGQADDQPITLFTVKKDGNDAYLDFKGGGKALTLARVLTVEAHPNSQSTVTIEFDWSEYSAKGPPTFEPSPATPSISWEHDTPNWRSTVTVPVPEWPNAWYIWDNLGGEIPGFDLKVRVKRKV